MEVDDRIYGILNYKQLEFFCKRFNIEPTELHANFDGWRKLVLYTEDKVFLFPRDPSGVFWLDMETTVYELFNDYPNLPVPRFFEKVKDDKINYYDFTVASRLKGIPYSKIEEDVTLKEVSRMLTNLSSVFALWHEIPIQKLPGKIMQRTELFDENQYKWEIQLLSPKTMQKAVNHVHQEVIKYAGKSHKELLRILDSDQTKSIWNQCLTELVSLSHVLVHADIHEDQILVESKDNMKITGILDWETVMYGHPVWEFNFFEWGLRIWNWWEYFTDFRRTMWKTYLDKRGIELNTLEGLDLFYSLSEFLIILKPGKSLRNLIGNDFSNSLKLCLEKLVNITERLVIELKK
ncbi:MAG: aminoglycoside phosphotransferase family protein [Candidatus Heimdallarchaeota archaeon]|nr:aminoglycoside phosphotransferase family protein [Candidatus Heimdallarchaeota archaeon]MCK4877439.1 aminoglycoside phosphotransferase family protein [Candidatus Heimdallarchaeota archaeon]